MEELERKIKERPQKEEKDVLWAYVAGIWLFYFIYKILFKIKIYIKVNMWKELIRIF